MRRQRKYFFSPRFNPNALENIQRRQKFFLVSRFPNRYHRRLLPPIRPYHRIVALICNSSKGTHHPLSSPIILSKTFVSEWISISIASTKTVPPANGASFSIIIAYQSVSTRSAAWSCLTTSIKFRHVSPFSAKQSCFQRFSLRAFFAAESATTSASERPHGFYKKPASIAFSQLTRFWWIHVG